VNAFCATLDAVEKHHLPLRAANSSVSILNHHAHVRTVELQHHHSVIRPYSQLPLVDAITLAFRKIMGFLKRIRSRSRIKSQEAASYDYGSSQPSRTARYSTTDFSSRLPLPVLDRVFSYVCPHTQDETYLPSEDSMVEDGCMPCDLRDLAQASLVCSRWNECAMKRL
jgi:hypothetical protein